MIHSSFPSSLTLSVCALFISLSALSLSLLPHYDLITPALCVDNDQQMIEQLHIIQLRRRSVRHAGPRDTTLMSFTCRNKIYLLIW